MPQGTPAEIALRSLLLSDGRRSLGRLARMGGALLRRTSSESAGGPPLIDEGSSVSASRRSAGRCRVGRMEAARPRSTALLRKGEAPTQSSVRRISPSHCRVPTARRRRPARSTPDPERHLQSGVDVPPTSISWPSGSATTGSTGPGGRACSTCSGSAEDRPRSRSTRTSCPASGRTPSAVWCATAP